MALSKLANLGVSSIRYHLTRRNVAFRQGYTKRASTSRRRSSRPRAAEFSDATKRLAFVSAGGSCQHCTLPIPHWRAACYHHRLPVARGGTARQDNCLLLHSSCHFDPVVFEQLHGFPSGGYPLPARRWAALQDEFTVLLAANILKHTAST